MNQFAPLHINFARRNWKSLLAATPLWMLALALLGALLLLCAALAAGRIAERQVTLDQTLQANAKKRQASQRPAAKAPPIPEGRALAVNAAIAQLNLPWSDVFDAIEAATPASIALVSIEPDAKKQLLKGEAEAISSDDMIAYIEQLKKVPLFSSVVLVKHEVNLQDPFKPYRFQFEAQWKEAAREH